MNEAFFSPAIADKIKLPGLTGIQQSGVCFFKPLPVAPVGVCRYFSGNQQFQKR